MSSSVGLPSPKNIGKKGFVFQEILATEKNLCKKMNIPKLLQLRNAFCLGVRFKPGQNVNSQRRPADLWSQNWGLWPTIRQLKKGARKGN